MDLDKLKFALHTPRHLSTQSAWVQHIPFAFVLVDLLWPRSIVELGTYTGDSYCALCQAVDTLQLSTRCAAVDTWTGDAQTGAYSPATLETLRAYHDPLYGRFSRLVQSSFDDAAPEFPAKSIDLLHIDGCHDYAAVRHDLETWLPKLSSRGVVILHDTQVRDGNFGVFRLWEEIAPKYKSFEFTHGYGLGVLAAGSRPPRHFRAFLAWARKSPDLVRAWFAALGARIEFARGTAQLARASAGARERWRRALISCGLTIAEPAGLAETRPALQALLEPDTDLKRWFDHCGAALDHHAGLARGLEQHQRGVQAEIRALRGQIAALRDELLRRSYVASAAPAGTLACASVYWPDRDGHFSQDRVRDCYFPADGRPHEAAFHLDIPAPASDDQVDSRRLRFDPGNRPALWLISNVSIRFAGAEASEPLPAEALCPAGGAMLLPVPAVLDTPPGPHYVLLCHSVDPQVELHIGPLLPAGDAVLELSMECRVWDKFGVFADCVGSLGEGVAGVLADALARAPAPAGLVPAALPTSAQISEPERFGA